MANPLGKLVPATLRRPIRRARRRSATRIHELAARCVLAVALFALRLRPSLAARGRFLRALRFGWHNEASSAPIPLLQAVERGCRTARGDVLDVGSGLTTIVAAAAVQGTGARVTSLEHHEMWADRVRAATRRFARTRVLCLPLVERGDHEWYDLDPDELPGPVSFVVCDGPPAATEGGRYGLLPAVTAKLTPGALVLLDDADRPGETEVLERWEREFDARVETVPNAGRTYARVVMPGPSRT